MATSDPYIGRREAIGLGIEGTAGTTVVPQTWLRWSDSNIRVVTDVQENDSAIGVVDRVSDSDIVNKYVEGTIGGNIGSKSIGYLLLGMWGSVSTGSPTSGIYPHTFSVNQSSIPTALTIAVASPLKHERHGYGTIDSFELDAPAGGYVTVSNSIKARIGATSSETVAFTSEENFTSRHISVKLADTVANLAAASKVKAASFKLTASRPSNGFLPLGENSAVPAVEFDRGAFEASGELVVRMTDTQYETDFLANTVHAMSVTLSNGDDSLVFTASQVRYRELEKSTDKDGIVTATLAYFCEHDQATGSSIVPVLNNAVSVYEAAS